MSTYRVVFGVLLLIVGVIVHAPLLRAAEPLSVIPDEDYSLYDQIVTKKFLTSDARLVILERMTVVRLIPGQEGSITVAEFQDQGYFDGALPSDLIRDFVAVNLAPTRLEGRFQFGVRYRFVSGNTVEEPEVRLAFPVRSGSLRPAQAPPVLDRLAFSRIGRTLRNDQALAYVENKRPDGTGAGFLVWFRRHERDWTVYDTEVVWTVRNQEHVESPLLAPEDR